MKSRIITPRDFFVTEDKFEENTLYVCKKVLSGGGREWIGEHAWKVGNRIFAVYHGVVNWCDNEYFGRIFLFTPVPKGKTINYREGYENKSKTF